MRSLGGFVEMREWAEKLVARARAEGVELNGEDGTVVDEIEEFLTGVRPAADPDRPTSVRVTEDRGYARCLSPSVPSPTTSAPRGCR